jgi:hypothetical protein
MSELIAAKAKGELLERYKDEKEKIDDDGVTESDFIRDLLDRGLRDRRVQLFLRLDLPNRVAAQMENDRDRGESDKTVIRRFLTEAVEAREADTLEKIGIDEDDDLRALVEREQNPGEPLDDAVRRLVRAGAKQTQDARLRRLGGSWAGRVVLTLILLSGVTVAIPLFFVPSEMVVIIASVSALLLFFLAVIVSVISIVANTLLARPLRAAFGFEIDTDDTTATTEAEAEAGD